MKIRAYRQLAVIIVGGALAAIVLYSGDLSHWLLEQPAGKPLRQESHYQNCQLVSGCELEFDRGRVVLNIEPTELPVLKPLAIRLQLSGLEAEKVSMTFTGRDMLMNLPAFPLLFQHESSGVQQFEGVGNISFCTTDEHMIWLARLVIWSDSAITTVNFELEE